jgi:hypothetical protein
LAHEKGTLIARCLGRKAGIHPSIEGQPTNRPQSAGYGGSETAKATVVSATGPTPVGYGEPCKAARLPVALSAVKPSTLFD